MSKKRYDICPACQELGRVFENMILEKGEIDFICDCGCTWTRSFYSDAAVVTSCSLCGGRGFLYSQIFDGQYDVERCDTCEKYDSDEDAMGDNRQLIAKEANFARTFHEDIIRFLENIARGNMLDETDATWRDSLLADIKAYSNLQKDTTEASRNEMRSDTLDKDIGNEMLFRESLEYLHCLMNGYEVNNGEDCKVLAFGGQFSLGKIRKFLSKHRAK